MEELKKKVTSESKNLISKLVNELQDAKKTNTYIDESKLLLAVAEHFANLDNHFNDYKERAKETTKKGWLK
jgi:hypothetical protein